MEIKIVFEQRMNKVGHKLNHSGVLNCEISRPKSERTFNDEPSELRDMTNISGHMLN